MTQHDLTDYTDDEAEAASSVASEKKPNPVFVPDSCIGFDISADYAHFRKVGTNSAKPTYYLPPRTTVAGLLAGIMGMPRDSYYDLFQPSTSAISVVPKEMPHTYTMGITTVNTKADDAIQYLPKEKHWQSSAEMLTPESYVKYDRQRDTYEMLVDPTYRVYVALKDEIVHEELAERLENSRYHYSPSLGLSECIAQIDKIGTHSVSSTSTDSVDSASYDDSVVMPEPETTIKRERAPLYMEATDGSGRRTTEFGNITYTADGSHLPVDGTRTYDVGPHQVVFY